MYITVDDFKNHFTRDFPYLPFWEDGKAYFKGDEVFDGTNFYTSLVNANLQPLSNTQAWTLCNDTVENYLTDEDIEKAINEAGAGFNAELFENNPKQDFCERKLVFLYLVAFYVVLDIKNSALGLTSNAYTTFTASKSVGNVHESYGIPQWVQTNPMYALYLDNGYGKKYLSFLIPKITGFFYLSKGATTWDV